MSRRRHAATPQSAQLAELAARWMLDSGNHDFNAARRHALERLPLTARELPDNAAIDGALIDYQRLFHRERYARQLLTLHRTALGVMRLLSDFRPRLVGELLSGALVTGTPVRLHLQVDTPEQVSIFLLDRHIPYQLDACSLRFGAQHRHELPLVRFEADEQTIELTLFVRDAHLPAPISPVDGRPMQRLGPEQVEQRLHDLELGATA